MIKQALIGTNIITTGVCSKRIDPRSLTAGFESQFIILKVIGVDLGGGSPSACPHYLRNAQAFIGFYHIPPKFGFAPPIFRRGKPKFIFDKFTPVIESMCMA